MLTEKKGNISQVGQSRGQHDWVHGFPELVKSLITFVILNQISYGKVKKPSYFSAQDCVKVSLRFAVVSQLTSTNRRKNGKFSAIGYTLQLVEVIWKTAANPREAYTVFVQKNMSFFCILPNGIWVSITRVMNDFRYPWCLITGSQSLWT